MRPDIFDSAGARERSAWLTAAAQIGEERRVVRVDRAGRSYQTVARRCATVTMRPGRGLDHLARGLLLHLASSSCMLTFSIAVHVTHQRPPLLGVSLLPGRQ